MSYTFQTSHFPKIWRKIRYSPKAYFQFITGTCSRTGKSSNFLHHEEPSLNRADLPIPSQRLKVRKLSSVLRCAKLLNLTQRSKQLGSLYENPKPIIQDSALQSLQTLISCWLNHFCSFRTVMQTAEGFCCCYRNNKAWHTTLIPNTLFWGQYSNTEVTICITTHEQYCFFCTTRAAEARTRCLSAMKVNLKY